jgi:membrane-associated HD superfamily phosphohydrolase
LKKIEQAEERVALELSTLTEKKQKMDDEINYKFNKVSEIKSQEEQKKTKMIKEELKGKKQTYEDEVREGHFAPLRIAEERAVQPLVEGEETGDARAVPCVERLGKTSFSS